MIGYEWRHLMLIHILRVHEVFMMMHFLYNGCTFNKIGQVSKGDIKILTFGYLKMVVRI